MVHGGEGAESRPTGPTYGAALSALEALLQELARVLATGDAGEERIVDLEMAILLCARSVYVEWLKGEGSAAGSAPAQFLRAWNDSAGRAAQLLRARRALRGGSRGQVEDLLEEVLTDLEGLPALARTQPPSAGSEEVDG